MTASELDAWRREAAAMQVALGRALERLAALGAVEVGATARDALWHDGKVVLWRYRPLATRARAPALLLVYALVNRPYVLDLEPERSLVRGLLAAGLDVHLLDWGGADRDDRSITLEDYVLGHLDRAVRTLAERHGAVDVAGVCQGGTLALAYAALEPARVHRLVTMVTPVDFHTPDNLLAKWVRGVDIERFVDAYGVVPGALLNAAFRALQPFRLTWGKLATLAELADDPAALATFARMERWIADSPDQAGRAFLTFVRELYQRNALVAGTFALGGRVVDLARVTMPVLNVYATRDHLVPPSASRALAQLVGSRDYEERAVEGGHIGIYVGARARELPAALAAWLARG